MTILIPYIYVGIDPGLDGAIAVYRPGADPLADLTIWPMPTFINHGTRKRHVDVDALVKALRVASHMGVVDGVILEDVHASPNMGVVSAFSFGRSRGVIEGVLTALDMPPQLVQPQIWKHATRTPKEKDGAIARATELFPDYAALYWPRKGDDGKAEAAILAWYAWKIAPDT